MDASGGSGDKTMTSTSPGGMEWGTVSSRRWFFVTVPFSFAAIITRFSLRLYLRTKLYNVDLSFMISSCGCRYQPALVFGRRRFCPIASEPMKETLQFSSLSRHSRAAASTQPVGARVGQRDTPLGRQSPRAVRCADHYAQTIRATHTRCLPALDSLGLGDCLPPTLLV
jgi:hypothetical protein